MSKFSTTIRENFDKFLIFFLQLRWSNQFIEHILKESTLIDYYGSFCDFSFSPF